MGLFDSLSFLNPLAPIKAVVGGIGGLLTGGGGGRSAPIGLTPDMGYGVTVADLSRPVDARQLDLAANNKPKLDSSRQGMEQYGLYALGALALFMVLR